MIWWLIFEKMPFQFWREIWIQVVVILLLITAVPMYIDSDLKVETDCIWFFFSQLPSTREVGNQAAWSLSSCKPGFGVEQIRDDNYETYWQSDGQLPHLVNIQFKRKTTVSAVAIYTDFRYLRSLFYYSCWISFNYVKKELIIVCGAVLLTIRIFK